MASSKARLDRYTLFVDDNDNDRNLKPLPLANNHENSWFPQPDDTTADTELVRSRTVQAGQKTVQTLSLLGSSTVEPQVWLDIPITSGSLWNKYKRIHKRNLGGLVIA
ncbi:hypothetical protein A1F96_11354, partial [Pyrenophora tritici-repentis]